MSGHVKIKILKWDKDQVAKIHKVGDTKLSHQLLEQGHKFIPSDGKEEQENENIDVQNEKTPLDRLTEQQQNDGGSGPKKTSDKRSARQKRNQKQTFKSSKTKSTVMSGFLQDDKAKMNKYSYTVSYHHKQNPRIMRQREMNRQHHIRPYKGLKEILMKKKYLLTDDLESVNSDDYKDFQELEAERNSGKIDKKALKVKNAILDLKAQLSAKKKDKPDELEQPNDDAEVQAPSSATLKNNKIMD